MKIRKKWAVIVAAMTAFIVKAWVQLIIAIAVLIIGGVIIYYLYQLSKLINNPSGGGGGTNTASGQMSVGYENTNHQTYLQYVAFLNAPYGIHTNYYNPGRMNLSTANIANGFTLLYGLDTTNNPWIQTPDRAPVQGNQTVSVQTLSDTASNYSIAITAFGVTMDYSATTNGSNGDAVNFYFYPTNVTTSATNADGDSATAQVNVTNVVVIYRSTNFIDWLPILTNNVSAGAIETLVDLDTGTEAFYKIERN